MKRRPALLLAPVVLAAGALVYVSLSPTSDPAGDLGGHEDPAGPSAANGQGSSGPGTPAKGSRDEPARPDLPGVAAGRISGVVRDEAGAPLAGATVRVAGAPEGGERPSVTTSREGVFVLEGLTSGLHALRAEARGRVALEVSGVAAGTRGIDLVLVPGRLATVRVRREEDGRPVEDATVEASTGEWSGSAVWSGRAQVYELDGAPAGPVRLAVVAPALVPAFTERFVPASGPAEFEIELATGREATGRVQDAVTGQGLEEAEVEIWNEDFGAASARRTTAGPGGAFEVRGLAPGPIGIRIRASGYPVYDSVQLGQSWLVGTTDDVFLEIPIPRGLAISGRVAGPSGPVRGAHVWAREPAGEGLARASTDAAGRFALAGVPVVPGLYLVASAKGLVPARTPELAWEGSEGPAPVEIRLEEGVVVAGRVADPSSNPIPAVRVVADVTSSWLGEVHPLGIEVQTDGEGRFRLGPLGPGTYPILFQHPDYRPHATSIEIPEGARFRELPLETVLRPGAVLAGTIADETGAGVPGAAVVAEQVVPGAAEQPLATSHSGFDGAFRIASLASGPVRLRVYAPGFLPAEAGPFPAGDETVRIVLRRRYLISGYLNAPPLPEGEDHDHEPGGHHHAHGLGQFTVRLTPYGDAAGDAEAVVETFHPEESSYRFVLDGVPEGAYVLEVIAAGYRPSRVEPFLPSDWVGRDLVVTLDPGLILSGRVVSAADGLPVPGALVVRGDDLSTFDPVSPEAHQRVLGYTNADGRFRVSGLDPRGVVVTICHELHAPVALRDPASTGDLVVRLPAGGTLSGVVLDEEGRPAPGVEVVAEGPVIKVIESDAEGRFAIEGLAPGRYRIVRLDRPPLERPPVVEIVGAETAEIQVPAR